MRSRPSAPDELVASPPPEPSYSRKSATTAPTTHRDDDGSTRMLNYAHRFSLGAAHLHLTAQLALLIYLGFPTGPVGNAYMNNRRFYVNRHKRRTGVTGARGAGCPALPSVRARRQLAGIEWGRS